MRFGVAFTGRRVVPFVSARAAQPPSLLIVLMALLIGIIGAFIWGLFSG